MIHTYYVIFCGTFALFLAQKFKTKVLTAQRNLLLECQSCRPTALPLCPRGPHYLGSMRKTGPSIVQEFSNKVLTEEPTSSAKFRRGQVETQKCSEFEETRRGSADDTLLQKV